MCRASIRSSSLLLFSIASHISLRDLYSLSSVAHFFSFKLFHHKKQKKSHNQAISSPHCRKQCLSTTDVLLRLISVFQSNPIRRCSVISTPLTWLIFLQEDHNEAHSHKKQDPAACFDVTAVARDRGPVPCEFCSIHMTIPPLCQCSLLSCTGVTLCYHIYGCRS